jgi:very-short-patch-repair endonuclease
VGEAPPQRRGEEVTMARIHRSQLSAIATQLRHAPTFGEAALWQELRRAKLGVTFRRQVPLRGFIVDFYASSARLIVEVDGGYHSERPCADARRDRELERHGFRVVRLAEQLVVTRRAEAVAAVRAVLEG